MKKFSPSPPPPNITNIPKDKIIGKQRKKFSPPPPNSYKSSFYSILQIISDAVGLVLFITFSLILIVLLISFVVEGNNEKLKNFFIYLVIFFISMWIYRIAFKQGRE